MIQEPRSAAPVTEPILPAAAVADHQADMVGHAADLSAHHENSANKSLQSNASPESVRATYEDPPFGKTMVEALADSDPQGFQWGLIQALGEHARAVPADRRYLAAMLCQIGSALQYELDDDLAFDDFIQGLSRRRSGFDSLRAAIPVVAGFLARVVARPLLQAKAPPTPADLTRLLVVAHEVVRGSCERSGMRAWQLLPQIAETIASRGALRGVSVGALTEALPRLRERLCPRNHEPQRRPAAASASVNLGEM
jgi:hypothetical protein